MASLNVPHISPEQAAAAIQESRNARAMQCIHLDINGDAHEHPFPNRGRVQQYGELIWSPDVITDNDFDTIILARDQADNKIHMRNPNALLMRTGTQDGNAGWQFTGLDIEIPADGMMDFLLYSNSDSIGAISITLFDEDNDSIKYEFRNGWGAHTAGGQISLVTWNPATDANKVLLDPDHDQTRVTDNGFDFSQKITKISFYVVNFTAGDEFYIDGAYTHTKIKPMIMFAFDTSHGNVGDNFIPIWDANNFTATYRMGGSSANWNAYNTELFAAYDRGHSISNGSSERTGLNDTTDMNLLRMEAGQSQNRLRARGIECQLFSTFGNTSPERVARATVAKEFGMKWWKAPNDYNRVNHCGPNGFDDPTWMMVHIAPTRDEMLEHIAGLKYTGGWIVYFPHACTDFYEADGVTLSSQAQSQGLSAGDEFTTTSDQSASSVWTEAIEDIAATLRVEVDAGNLDVIGMREFDLIMHGLL